jgi:DNA repair protein RecO (recombination protein O)
VSRTFSSECIILRKYRVGEIHKGLVLLTEARGIVSAIAHGALKPGSRLASSTEPITHARVFLYHDPVKDSHKVTDCAVISSFEQVKLDLVRFFTSSLWMEAVLRSLGGGGTDASVYWLLRDSLQCLDAAAEAAVERVDLQFLWRFLGLAGFRPDVDTCASCGARVPEEDPIQYPAGSRALVCAACAARIGRPALEMSPGARRYLGHSLAMPLALAVRIVLARPVARSLRRLSTELLESVLETRLKTLEAGAGIV